MSTLSMFEASVDVEELTQTQKKVLAELKTISLLLAEGLNLKLDPEKIAQSFLKE